MIKETKKVVKNKKTDTSDEGSESEKILIEKKTKSKPEPKPKPKPKPKKESDSDDDFISDSDDEGDDDDDDDDDEYPKKSLYSNVPILIVLCDKLCHMMENGIDEIEIICNHLPLCNDCDITDNHNNLAKVLHVWNKADVSFDEVDSDNTKFQECLKLYHDVSGCVVPENVNKSKIEIYNIVDDGNIYDNCMLIHYFIVWSYILKFRIYHCTIF